MTRTHPLHNRIEGLCKFVHDESVTWNCPGCQQHRPAAHQNHTYEAGQCRYGPGGDAELRFRGHKRSGRHPREPGRKASRCPTSEAQPQLSDGTDLGAGDEAEVADEGAKEQSKDDDEERPPHDGSRQSVEPIIRRKWTDTGTGPEKPRDWTRFDIGSSLAVLRRGSNAACIRELRKLHLRWWHLPVTPFANVLRQAGVAQRIIDMIKDIVNTCRECREWQLPGKATKITATLSEHFNQNVEGDILFVMSYMIFHLVDRCTRWKAGEIIEHKDKETLIQALHTTWIGIHGHMDNFIIDGESSLYTQDARARLASDGIQVRTKAPGQHASYAERYDAVCRSVIHLLISQLKREGITVSMKVILSQVFFAMNAMTAVGTSLRTSTSYATTHRRGEHT